MEDRISVFVDDGCWVMWSFISFSIKSEMKPSQKTPTKDDSKQNHLARKKTQTQIHNNCNKCKTIIAVPRFVLHKLGVCLKPAKKSRSAQWFWHILSSCFHFSFLASSSKTSQGQVKMDVKRQKWSKELSHRQCSFCTYRMLTPGFPNLGVSLSDKGTSPSEVDHSPFKGWDCAF